MEKVSINKGLIHTGSTIPLWDFNQYILEGLRQYGESQYSSYFSPYWSKLLSIQGV